MPSVLVPGLQISRTQHTTGRSGTPICTHGSLGGAGLGRARRRPGVGRLVGDGDELRPVPLLRHVLVPVLIHAAAAAAAAIGRPGDGRPDLRDRLGDLDEGLPRGFHLRELCRCCCSG